MDMEINFPNLGIYLDYVGKNISIFGFSIAYYRHSRNGCTYKITRPFPAKSPYLTIPILP